MEKELICGDCNMAFRSTGLLEKHKAQFCIGREIGNLLPRRHSSEIRNNGGGVDPKQTRTPDLVQMRGQQRNFIRWRSADAEPKPGRTEAKQVDSQTDSAALQNLSDEFHKLKMSIEENLSNCSKKTTDTEASEHQLGHRERLKQMREMATLHERQLALIHADNQQLEQQRDELAHQVSVLSEQKSTAHLEHLLVELREQEERNEETLQQLAEHLRALHMQQVSLPADQPDLHKMMHRDFFELISSVDAPLSAQIKSLRQAYMQSGGSDPVIVAQMIDLQAEAQTLERNQPGAAAKARKKKVKHHPRGLNWELLAVEQENQRLEEEILRIQLARDRCYDEAVRTELELSWKKEQITSLEAEMDRSKEPLRPRREHPLSLQNKTHIHAPLSLLQARAFSSPLGRCVTDPLDSLGPAPYDPVAGFVVFFDLVMGVDISQKALRLEAGLYSEGHEVGSPTPAPPVGCLLGVSLPYSQNPGNHALLSVKQPVPRIHPSPSLCLVVEVQAARDLDVSNQEASKLESCGWAQLELFDQYNQLRSGYWRVPVRSLPIRPSLSLAQLNTIPQVGNMELCVRLVNGRDGDAQTLAQPDLTSTKLYKYPAVVSTLLGHTSEEMPGSAPLPSGVGQLSSLLPNTDQKDSPPADESIQG